MCTSMLSVQWMLPPGRVTYSRHIAWGRNLRSERFGADLSYSPTPPKIPVLDPGLLTKVFFFADNSRMAKQNLLHVGICKLDPIQVVYRTCLFQNPTVTQNYDKRIRQTFQLVREWIVCFGLDPKKLLHIGIPTLENKQLVTYDCCIEFLFPIMENNCDIALRTLPGGDYAVLRVKKTPAQIRHAIDTFLSEHIPDNGLIFDENRPTYEIYYEDTMEYCVPIQK